MVIKEATEEEQEMVGMSRRMVVDYIESGEAEMCKGWRRFSTGGRHKAHPIVSYAETKQGANVRMRL